jgi:tetratricopeptide (TPR) repeat protein
MNAKIGRNDPCACGSGKKYKRCCGEARGAQAGRPPATDAHRPAEELESAEWDRLVAMANAGGHAELENRVRELLSGLPASGMLWRLLGLAQWMQGKDALHALQKTSELLPGDAEARSNLGTALRGRGRLSEAIACYRRALEINPDFADAHNNLGATLRDLGQLDEAVASYRRALALKPEFAVAHCNLGDALLAQGKYYRAEASCRQAIALDPGLAEAHNNLGMALRLQGSAAEAELSSRRALEIDPNCLSALVALAQLQADNGQFIEAEALLKRAISIDPDSPDAWAGIPRLRKMTVDDTDWLAAAQRVAGGPLSPRREGNLRYAMGKYFDDVGDYEQAFKNYQRANDLPNLHGASRHDRRVETQKFDRIIEFYDRPWVSRPRSVPNASERPVLIVGMPRSGTTLAEQILAAHPAVFGAGELPFWVVAEPNYRLAAEPDDEKLRGLTEGYLQRLQALAPDAQRVVDKMPDNFKSLGLIHAALPNARIVHMRRNPIDTCLSIYFQDFGAGHTYANALEDLAHYYGDYRRIMEHWRATLPEGTILEVPYERLTQDAEGWSRKMIDFIGLSWDPKCLDFDQVNRKILTFSKWQARQKVHRSSVERWRKYEKFVAPLLHLAESDPEESFRATSDPT